MSAKMHLVIKKFELEAPARIGNLRQQMPLMQAGYKIVF